MTNSPKKDEHYVLELCDRLLGEKSSKQHRFDFLLGDKNAKGRQVKLPVDGYYINRNLVVEYCERQHTEAVDFFDKPDKLTISGIHRGLQRKIYDERRRTVLNEKGFILLEFSYTDFQFDRRKRIIRNEPSDTLVIASKLKAVGLLKPD
jgi:hypothetical protein